MTRTKPSKNFFNIFLIVIKFGRLSTLPEREEQYHLAKSLTSTLEGRGHPEYKQSVLDSELWAMKLYQHCY